MSASTARRVVAASLLVACGATRATPPMDREAAAREAAVVEAAAALQRHREGPEEVAYFEVIRDEAQHRELVSLRVLVAPIQSILVGCASTRPDEIVMTVPMRPGCASAEVLTDREAHAVSTHEPAARDVAEGFGALRLPTTTYERLAASPSLALRRCDETLALDEQRRAALRALPARCRTGERAPSQRP